MKEFLGNCLMYCQKVQTTNFLSQFNKLTALIDGHSKFNFKPTPDFLHFPASLAKIDSIDISSILTDQISFFIKCNWQDSENPSVVMALRQW